MIIAFWPREKAQWYVPGTYGHVSILDFKNDTWFELEFRWASFNVNPFYTQADIEDVLSERSANCKLVSWEKQERPAGVLRPLTCVSLARQYSGVPSRALFPDALLRDFLTNGGEIVNANQRTENSRA